MRKVLTKKETIEVIELLFGSDSNAALGFVADAEWLGREELNDLMWTILEQHERFEDAEFEDDSEYDDSASWEDEYELGFDPYMGCYSDDC